MILKNAEVFLCGSFWQIDVRINGGLIQEIGYDLCGDEICDLTGKLLLPGFIDIHTHGCCGYDFSECTLDEINEMAKFYARNGVTSIIATTMTMADDKLISALSTLNKAITEGTEGSSLIGINLEGPYISRDKSGAHDVKFLSGISQKHFNSLHKAAGENLKIVTVDPCLENVIGFIQEYRNSMTIALGHTNCTYNQAVNAVNAGASHITHLFNAMRQPHHREPALLGVLVDRDVTAELICDGIHIHESIIRMMFKLCPSKIVLVSDSISACGSIKSQNKLGGQKVIKEGNTALLENGSIAGSVITLNQAVKKAVKFGVEKEKAILSATLNPARVINMDNIIGSIEVGKRADLLVTDKELNIQKVFIKGKIMV
ncbi:MAG TPA: N-acetylglucosamine-6-phosphate deacetylase [Clostridiales bacterium]|nr:N-acetylglucosamine-6-phosphate deacetylase [Clostridiales bacterium]